MPSNPFDEVTEPLRSQPTGETRRKQITTDLADSAAALLVVLAGPGSGRRLRLTEEVTIGRAPDCTLTCNLADVSRRHARVRRENGTRYVLEDLDSRNGTLVNGLPVRRHVLSFGDRVQIGSKTILLFSYHDQLEEQLLQSQKMESVGQLAGGIAHDYNNLLGAVMSNVDYLDNLPAQTTFADPDVRDCIGEVKQAVTRAVELTRQLLGFAQRGKYEELPTNLSTLVQDVAAIVRRTFDRAIEVRVEVEPDLMISGDRAQLRQVLMNLCLNARDAMPAGGQLLLAARRVELGRGAGAQMAPFLISGDFVAVSVSDTGQGMDEKTRARAFDPFFTTKPAGQGSGLGLATVYGVVRNHGGHVQAVSEPGEGATFKLFLPSLRSGGDVHDTHPTGATPQITEGQVLLVEDEEMVRNSTRRLLEQMGFTVLCAEDGLRGVEAFEQHHDTILFVVLDLVMPRMDGAEAFQRMRRILPSIKVIVASGYSDKDQAIELLTDGAATFLPKPFDSEMLLAAIARALDDN